MNKKKILAARAAIAASEEASYFGKDPLRAFLEELSYLNGLESQPDRFTIIERSLEYVYRNCYSDLEWFDLAYNLYCREYDCLMAS